MRPAQLIPTNEKTRLHLSDETNLIKIDATAASELPTIFWRGRITFPRMFAFFAENCPATPHSTFSAVFLRSSERIATPENKSISKLRDQFPTDARFVRLEHGPVGHSDAPTADFVIWARIDLARIEKGQEAPDYIGVAADRHTLSRVADELAKLASGTSIYELSQGGALKNIQKILRHQTSG